MPVYRGNGVAFDVFLGDVEPAIMLGSGQFIIGSGDSEPPFEPGEQLPPGVRATSGTVGYLGDPDDLTVLNDGDPLPEEWSAVWDEGALIVLGDNVVIDHYRINATVVFFGDNPTVTNCQIYPPVGGLYGLTINGYDRGVLTVMDTTVVGSGEGSQINGLSSDSGLVAIRCDISGTQDCIHFPARETPGEAVISQCVGHDQAFTNEEMHCDGFQVFPPNPADAEGFVTIEHSSVHRTLSTIGTPMNSSMIAGVIAGHTDPLQTVVIDNNYFEAGLYHVSLGHRMQNVEVTNNDFGPLHSGEFGLFGWEEASTIVAFTNNRDENGDLLDPPT